LGVTSIQWTSTPRPDGTFTPGYTFNGWRGCVKVSPGCTNCYAEKGSKRNPNVLGIWGKDGTRVAAAESYWAQLPAWDRAAAKAGERHKVFCFSLADWLEDWDGECLATDGTAHYTADDGSFMVASSTLHGSTTDDMHSTTLADLRLRLFQNIAHTPNLDYLLLTKRPEGFRCRLAEACDAAKGRKASAVWDGLTLACDWLNGTPPPNVWVGASVENQDAADERIPILLSIPARVRFLSMEPLLGSVDLTPWLECQECRGKTWDRVDVHPVPCPVCGGNYRGVDWAIIGGESGPRARPFDLAWCESIVDQCRAAGVACFVKQFGSCPVATPVPGYTTRLAKLKDSHGGDPEEWPERFRVREFPAVV
jgi:protein gp37